MSFSDLERRLQELPPEAWEPIAPPPLDRERVFGAPQLRTAPPVPAARAGGWRAFPLRPAFALVTAAAVLSIALDASGVFGGAEAPTQVAAPVATPPDTRTQVALTPFEQPGKAWAAQVALPATAGQQAALRVADLPKTPAGHHYEAWLLSERGDPVSLASFHVGTGGTADLSFPVNVDPAKFAYLDISLEADDGNAGHSGESLLRSAELT